MAIHIHVLIKDNPKVGDMRAGSDVGITDFDVGHVNFLELLPSADDQELCLVMLCDLSFLVLSWCV